MKLILNKGVVMLILSLIFQNVVMGGDETSVEFTNAKIATDKDGKEVKYYLKGNKDVQLEIKNIQKERGN